MRVLTPALIALAVIPAAFGGTFAEYTDKAEWQAIVDQWTSISFTELPLGSIVTTQYASLGATFSDGDDSITFTDSFLQDKYGLQGSSALNPDDSITVEFHSPMYSIAADYPGTLQMELYSLGQLIHTTEIYGGGEGNFLGVISTVPFDRARIIDPFNFVFIDDLHFGPPIPGPAALAALFCGLLAVGSRRRS